MTDLEDDSNEIDPSIMAAMGFGNFGMKPKKNASSKATISSTEKTSHQAKRQKTKPSKSDRQQPSYQGSGANNTPLSARRPAAPQEDGITTILLPSTHIPNDAEDNDDPGYIDSDAEPDEMNHHQTNGVPVATHTPAHGLPSSTSLNSSQHPLPQRPPGSSSSNLSPSYPADVNVDAPMDDERVNPDTRSYNSNYPPHTQRLPNGDYAYFLPDFIIDDPWEGMLPMVLPAQRSR